MRALVQRAASGEVRVRHDDGSEELAGRIGPGLVVLVGVADGDDEAAARKLADKVAHLRVFADDDGVPNLDVQQAGGEVLVVSQFTLCADTRKGRRPSYVGAARPEVAEPLVDLVAEELTGLGLTVATGRFRTHMLVELVNDGPITLLLEV